MIVPSCVLSLILLGAAVSAQDAFPVDRLMEVRLRMEPADWDALRRQPRPSASIYCGDCLARPIRHPFRVFAAHVEIDGETFERAGVRKKGFVDSLDSERPALKIDLGHFEKGRRFGGLRRLTLNNAKADPSLVRQCLAAALFREAGLPAPRCAFARLWINGRDLGPYVHLETVDRRFLRRYPALADGELWRGTLSDFRPAWLKTFRCRGRCSQDTPARLSTLAGLLERDGPLDLAALDRLIDLEAYLDHWAMESLILHQDGYSGNANNFFLVADAAGRLRFLPWGLDDAFPDTIDWRDPPHILVGAMLSWRLAREETVRARLEQKIRRLAAQVLDEERLAREALRMFGLVYPAIPEKARQRALDALAGVIDFLCERRAGIQNAVKLRLSNEGTLEETPCEPCGLPAARP